MVSFAKKVENSFVQPVVNIVQRLKKFFDLELLRD
jgi:hypothetical protein